MTVENIDVKITGDKMVLTVNLTKRLGPSRSGKTVLIATSKGNAVVAPGITIGLNVYTKEKEDSE